MNKVRAIALGLSLAVLPGCAVLDWFGENQDNPAVKTTVQFATLKVIDDDAERADRVVEVVQRVRGFVEGNEEATLGAIRQEVRNEIRWDRLDDAEKLVVNNLIDAVAQEIRSRIDEGLLAEEDKVVVRTVLEWIEEAAAMAGGVSDSVDEDVADQGIDQDGLQVGKETQGLKRAGRSDREAEELLS